MKILNVSNSISINGGGGMADRTIQMSRFLNEAKENCTILAISDQYSSLNKKQLNNEGIAIELLNVFIRRFNVPFLSFSILSRLVKDADVIHLMGHWSILNIYVYFFARFYNVPYVVCPAGSLAVFERSKILKTIYNFFF